MKARITSLNKDEKYMNIDLINSKGDACLHTQVFCNEDIKIYYLSVMSNYDFEKQKCIFVKNIEKIINKAFLIFDYDESKIKSIEFKENLQEPDYALIRFMEDKENGTDIDK